MSNNDEIGDFSGGQIHYWPGERSQQIIDGFRFDPKRSDIQLGIDPQLLAAEETIAGLIASTVLANAPTEFGTGQLRLATLRSREIVALALKPQAETEKVSGKSLVGYISGDSTKTSGAQTLAWLANALDAGVTESDLLAWGVSELNVIQLLWWQKRPGETRLSQHVRAYRNGWQLPLLSEAVRFAYCNLLRFINNGAAPDGFEEFYAQDLAEVRELVEFFGDKWDTSEGAAEPVVAQLDEPLAKKWAFAFSQNLSFIAPDAKGRWGSLPVVSLQVGQLRSQAEIVARYLHSQGYQPGDVGSNLTEAFFGRVGDSNV